MRRPDDVRRSPSPRRQPRNRAWLAIIVTVLVIFVMSLRGIARFYTDFLWFEEVGFTSVRRGMLLSKAFLSLGFTALFFVLMFGSLVIADRIAPTFRAVGVEDEIVARYQEA